MNPTAANDGGRYLAGPGRLPGLAAIPRPGAGGAQVGQPVADAPRPIPYLKLATENKLKLLLCLLLGAVAGVLVVIVERPVYSARTTVEVIGFNDKFMGMNQLDPQSGSDSNPAANIQTQVRLLQSRTLLRRVEERMNLELAPVTPAPSSIFGKLRKQILFLQEDPLLQSRQALGEAMLSLDAKALGATRLIEISCQSTSSAIAAAFVNTLAQEHIASILAARTSAMQHTSQWMESQMEEARVRLEDANGKLHDFVRKSGIDFIGEQTTLADSKVHSLQGDLAQIQTDRIAKQARWELAKQTASESLPDVMNDPSLMSLKSQIQVLHRDMAQLTATLTPAHYKVQRIQAQIAETEQNLEREKSAFMKRTQTDYEEALRKEKLLQSAYNSQTRSIAAQSDKAGQYAMLKRDVDTQQQIYNTLLQESNQAALIALAPTVGVRVVDAASASSIPSSLMPQEEIPGFALAGCVVGYGLLLLGEVSRRKKGTVVFYVPGHSQALLGVPELGVIPSVELPASSKKRLLFGAARNSVSLDPGAGTRDTGGSNGRYWDTTGSTLLSESFRQTLVSLLRSRPANCNPAYVITSAGASEGKTMLSANLGRAMAEVGYRVLLLDADLRKPHLHDVFSANAGPGVSDILASSLDVSKIGVEGYIQPTGFKNLSVMTHGSVSVESPGVLFFSPRVGKLVSELRSRFDYVLVDTAPTLLFPDARLWGSYADGVVLIVRAGVTTREGASAVCTRFVNDGIPVLGTILNDWIPDEDAQSNYSAGAYAKSDTSAV